VTLEAPEKINRDRLIKVGSPTDYILSDKLEVLCEGTVRSGKTWTVLLKINHTAREYPRSRQLVCRQTRKSLNESVLQDWRSEILWEGHEAVSPTASKEHQDRYEYRNGSVVFFAGMESMHDTASPLLSTKWDRIYIIQAEETDKKDCETLTTRLSSFKTPYHQITYDCNPAAPSHWLNTRFPVDAMPETRARFAFRLWDNPLFYIGEYPDGQWTKEGAQYDAILNATLSGVQRERFYKGLWIATEGQILDNWDPRINTLDGELTNDEHRGWMIKAPALGDQPIRVAYFTTGVDFGWDPDPGAMQLWAYDSPRWHPKVRRFRVAEVMKLRWQIDQWAELAESWWKTYDVKYFSCDAADPEHINDLNLRLSKAGHRNAPKLAVKCPPIGGGHRRNKNHAAAIDLMREGLGVMSREQGVEKRGHVRTYLLKDAFPEGIDLDLKKAGRSTSSEAEIESWVYDVDASGNPTGKPSRAFSSHPNALMCFPEGTKICVAGGECSIECVTIGQTVMVPYPDEVVAKWESNEEQDMYVLDLPWGTLRATGNHLLWTQHGWKQLAEICGDELLAWTRSPSSTTASSFIDIPSLRRTPPVVTSPALSGTDASSSTDTSGSANAGGDGWATRSITSTVTLGTIERATSKRSPVRSTTRDTPSVDSMQGFAVGSYRVSSQGIDRALLVKGGRGARPDHELAEYVAMCSSPSPGTRAWPAALTDAVRSTGGTLIPTIITVGAPRRDGRAKVYNLTVRRTARYIADGVMVSNCWMYDETLSFVRGFGRGMPIEERLTPGSDDWLLAKDLKDRESERRRSNQRREPWR